MNKVDFSFEGSTALITGGTAGIGKAIALAFARANANVVIVGTNHERGKAVVDEGFSITGKNNITFLAGNVADTVDAQRIVDETIRLHGRVDILINNAGITRDTLLLRMSDEDFDLVLDVNLKSCFLFSKAVLRPMLKAKKGKIISISSVVGLIGNPGQVNYAASKAGMIGLSKSLAREVASRSITVNCIAPGFIETAMTEAIPAEKKEALIEQIPLHRFGTPEEVAQLTLFLSSSAADYITGQVISIDGGLAM